MANESWWQWKPTQCDPIGSLTRDKKVLVVKVVVSVIIVIVISLLIAIICPWNAWNSGIPDGGWNSEESRVDIGIWELEVKTGSATTTYKYDDSGLSPDLTKYKDAGSAAFGLILFVIILLVVAEIIVVALLTSESKGGILQAAYMTVVPAFLLEFTAWVNWAVSIGDGDVAYGGAFIVAIVAWILLFFLLVALKYGHAALDGGSFFTVTAFGIPPVTKEAKDFRAQCLPWTSIKEKAGTPKDLGKTDKARIILIGIQVSFNTYTIWKAFVYRPSRNSNEYLNLSKIVVAWADFALLLLNWLLFSRLFCTSFFCAQPIASGSSCFYSRWFFSAGLLKYLGSVSMWKWAVACSPANLLRHVKDIIVDHKENGLEGSDKWTLLICMVVVRLFYGSLGALSILLKVASVHFVAEDEGWENSPSQVLFFLGFINQVVGGSLDRANPWEAGYSRMFSVIEFHYAVGAIGAEFHKDRKPIEETHSFMEAICSARIASYEKDSYRILGFLSLLTMDEVELYRLVAVPWTRNPTIEI